jgi:hypothetical protein
MTLKEKLRQSLTGHLSNDKTEVDVNIAAKIADDYAIEFAEWKDNNQYVRLIDGNWVSLIIDSDTIITSKELLEIFKKEKGL